MGEREDLSGKKCFQIALKTDLKLPILLQYPTEISDHKIHILQQQLQFWHPIEIINILCRQKKKNIQKKIQEKSKSNY